MATKNTKAVSDNNVVLFQEWFNKTYGQPTIAVDGMMSVGTQEAYAKHGKDYIVYLKSQHSNEINKLTAALEKEKRARADAELLSATAKEQLESMKTKAIIGTIGGLVFGAIIIGLIKVAKG
jgi:hypothetical protein